MAGRPNLSSIYKGVSWNKYHKKWLVNVSVNGGSKYVGRFVSEREAALAYDKAARELIGPHAITNFFEDDDDA